MNHTVQITLECDTEIVGEILAAANIAAKKHAKTVIVTSVEDKKNV